MLATLLHNKSNKTITSPATTPNNPSKISGANTSPSCEKFLLFMGRI